MDEVAGFFGTLIFLGVFVLAAILFDNRGWRNRK